MRQSTLFYFLPFLFCFMFFHSSGFSQVLYFEDFNDGELPDDLILYDIDGRSPRYTTTGPVWSILNGKYDEIQIASTSSHNPSGEVNDWMILPQIDIPADQITTLHYLVKKAYATNTLHYLRVKVSTTGTDVGDFTDEVMTNVLTNGNERLEEVDLSAYAGMSIYIAFVHNDTSDDYHIMLDNIGVVARNEDMPDIRLDHIRFADQYLLPGRNRMYFQWTNVGAAPINSFQINWTDGHQVQDSEVFNTLKKFGESYVGQIPLFSDWPTSGIYPVRVWISHPNNKTDVEPLNDEILQNQVVINHTVTKNVLIEEYTGTWCGWCTRGAIILREILKEVPGRIFGIAYHSGDEMAYPASTEFMSWIYASAFPTGSVDRARGDTWDIPVTYSTSSWEYMVYRRLESPVPVGLSAEINYNDANKLVNMDVAATFVDNDEGEFYLNAVVTEDGVTGYPQSNAYNNRTEYPELNGAGNPIVDYVHNHVARLSAGGSHGVLLPTPDVIDAGSVFHHQFEFNLPNYVDPANSHVQVFIYKEGGKFNERPLINVNQFPILASSIDDEVVEEKAITVFPNPTSDYFVIGGTEFDRVELMNLQGQSVKTIQNYGNHLSVSTAGIPAGVYVVRVLNNEDVLMVERLIVK